MVQLMLLLVLLYAILQVLIHSRALMHSWYLKLKQVPGAQCIVKTVWPTAHW